MSFLFGQIMKTGFARLLYVVVGLLSTLSLVLAFRLQQVQPELRELHRRKIMPVPGMFVPTVRAATETGDSVTIGELALGRAQILIYFSTSCQFCVENLPAWRALSDSLLADPVHRFDVIWVSISGADSTRSYVNRHGLNYPVVRMPHWKINRLLRVNGVPLTKVADNNGRIIYVHPSVFHNSAEIDSIYSAASASSAATAASVLTTSLRP